MATLNEYAQMAGRVYNRTDENRLDAPTNSGWKELNWLEDDPITGFSVGSYLKGDEMVISFTGTNESMIKDFVKANIPAGFGLGSVQIVQAMHYTQQMRLLYPGTKLSFTGHSLGGGLASVMAVFFNKPATVFDPAPFQLSAINPKTLAETYVSLFVDIPEFTDYLSGVALSFFEREKNVASYSLENEILDFMHYGFSVIAGFDTVLSAGNPEGLGGFGGKVKLHSITLLNLFLLDRYTKSFFNVVSEQRHALNVFFDDQLYAKDVQNNNDPDFLTKILKDAQSSNSQNLFQSLTIQLEKIGVGGMAGFDKQWQGVNKGVLAALTEYYEFLPDGEAAKDFLKKTQAGGIELDLSLISSDSDGKGVEKLLENLHKRIRLLETKDGIYGSVEDTKEKFQRIVLQSGSDALYADLELDNKDDLVYGSTGENDTVVAGGGDDFVVGLSGDDSLLGGDGQDTLIGGAGADVLNGGDGENSLKGGSGDDTLIGNYVDSLYGGYGKDVYVIKGTSNIIDDIDGGGEVYVKDKILKGVYITKKK